MGKLLRGFYTKVKSHFTSIHRKWRIHDPSREFWQKPPGEVPEDVLSEGIFKCAPEGEERLHVWGKVSYKVPVTIRGCKLEDNGQLVVTHENMRDLGEGYWLCGDCGECHMPGSGRSMTIYQCNNWDEGDEED